MGVADFSRRNEWYTSDMSVTKNCTNIKKPRK